MSVLTFDSLPMDPEALTPDWFSAALGTRVETVSTNDVIWGTATKVLVHLRYADPNNGLPTEICVKGGFDERLRGMADTNDAYRLEARFFGDLAGKLPVVLPQTFFCGITADEPQGIVVMEDLRDREARFGEPCDPLSTDEVAAGLETQARWHATTWGDARTLAPWLSTGSPSVRAAAQMLLSEGFWSYHRAQPQTPSIPAALDDRARVLRAFQMLWEYEDAQPGSLAHGDAHIGNTFILPDGTVGFLDWQGVCVAPWSYDVSYFIGGALSVADRRAHERDLLALYCSALAAAGGPSLDADDCWAAYRRHSLHGFLWAVTPPVMQSPERVQSMSERHLTAIEDLEPFALLGA
ncbi:MAG: hypothetical protein QOC69_6025 [Mycobacterium sp.]|jgi:hypothetical protein|nr:hypothetical protein [Mycobacterium sp.]